MEEKFFFNGGNIFFLKEGIFFFKWSGNFFYICDVDFFLVVDVKIFQFIGFKIFMFQKVESNFIEKKFLFGLVLFLYIGSLQMLEIVGILYIF